MKAYHFSCGDSGDGTIGFCAIVRAETEDKAISILKANLPEEWEIGVPPECDEIDYIMVYLNPRNLKSTDIDDSQEVSP